MYLLVRLSHREELLHVPCYVVLARAAAFKARGITNILDKKEETKKREEIRNKLHPYLYSSFLPTWCLFTISSLFNKPISSVVLLDLDGRGLAVYLCVVHLGSTGQLLVVAVLACVKPVKFSLPEI